jgi:hypothetical protein
MKKFLTVLVSACISFGCFSITGSCITTQAKESVYLPESSWVIAIMEAKLTAEGYAGGTDWKKKIVMGHSCVVEKIFEDDITDPKTTFEKANVVKLSVPVQENPFTTATNLSVEVKFEQPIDVETIMKSQTAPAIAYKIKLLNLAPSGECEGEIGEIESKEANATAKGFVFDEKTKIYSAKIGTYSWGYILVDSNQKVLFWCCHEAGEYKKENFYNLKDVLNSYWKSMEKLKELQSTSSWV